MTDEREVARDELREFAGIEHPSDEDIDDWLALSVAPPLFDPIEMEARFLIREHGRLAHNAVDGMMIGASTMEDTATRDAKLQRLVLVRERILDINRPWRRIFRRRRL